MGYLKAIANGYIMSLHIVNGEGNCGKEEYDSLEAMFLERPEAPEGYWYLLRADTLEWELVEAPEDDDVDDAEAIEILLGGAE